MGLGDYASNHSTEQVEAGEIETLNFILMHSVLGGRAAMSGLVAKDTGHQARLKFHSGNSHGENAPPHACCETCTLS